MRAGWGQQARADRELRVCRERGTQVYLGLWQQARAGRVWWVCVERDQQVHVGPGMPFWTGRVQYVFPGAGERGSWRWQAFSRRRWQRGAASLR